MIPCQYNKFEFNQADYGPVSRPKFSSNRITDETAAGETPDLPSESGLQFPGRQARSLPPG